MQKKRKPEDDPGPAEKRHNVQQEKVEVDPMNPIVAGGRGPPRSCRWKGLEAPFHDGGGLASPGRWASSERKLLQGEEWVKLRLQLRQEAVRKLGSLSEVEKEAFKMAKGGNAFSLVRDEEFLARVRCLLADNLGIAMQHCPEEGQPFFLDLMRGVLEKAGDPDWAFLGAGQGGFATGHLESIASYA